MQRGGLGRSLTPPQPLQASGLVNLSRRDGSEFSAAFAKFLNSSSSDGSPLFVRRVERRANHEQTVRRAGPVMATQSIDARA